MHAIHDLGYEYCTPIQAGVLQGIMQGRDAVGQAQTGTGKTAAFLIGTFTNLLRKPHPDPVPGTPRALVLAPTRELAIQIELEARELCRHTPFASLAVFGGQDYERQRRVLRDQVVDLVVATPGRLIDFLRSGDVKLNRIEALVIDEADRMLDMGFIPDVRRIVNSTPNKSRRQTMFFSATMSVSVNRLAEQWTTNPVRVEIEPENIAAETVDQAVFITTRDQKLAIIYNLLKQEDPERVLIFANRRDQASRLYGDLVTHGFKVELMTGAVPQKKRVRVLEQFRQGEIKVLVATDVAGRGIHVEGIDFVINYTLPEDPEDYVHRIGRTGRAGTEGKAFSFASEFDGYAIPDIEEYIKQELTCITPKESWLFLPKPIVERPKERGRGQRGGGRSGSRRGGGNRGGGRSRGGSRRSGR